MQFEIPLAEQKVKPHQVTALHLLAAFALLAASAIAFLLNNNMVIIPGKNALQESAPGFGPVDMASAIIMSVSIIIILAALFRNKWLRTDKVNKLFRVVELAGCAAVGIYLAVNGVYILATMFGILAATIGFSIMWESDKSSRSLSITVGDKLIRLPLTSRKRTIQWTETEKVLLRHGTITINCINNRMYQWTTIPNDTDKDIFEAYCDAQIEAARKNRGKYNW